MTGQIERRRRIGSDIQPDNTGRENDYKGTIYEYQVTQIQVSDAFRRRAFELYENKCVLTEIEESPLVTLSHIVPRSDEIGYAEDITNVMLLNWTHHVAFDSGIFTLDTDLRLRVNPAFKANDSWLRRTLLERDGKKLDLPEDVYLSEDRIRERNASIEWWPLSK
ncbi:HNH endonuclease [Halalkalicoccus sp. NIPERK01]|uniref:HNH endonuclease n=1 Tax=Halalkalicoccus sp. NIPERK01 TaxID=3053469 RepID=UPI00256EABFC|nr:HNH endonuclease signature motif containing protein [Halalkalicoccus sp. NIPERK01]MDL5362075.1 HNH endonuclease signature motif containing protein [Halalkalicoccus sp. NIPERK01]